METDPVPAAATVVPLPPAPIRMGPYLINLTNLSVQADGGHRTVLTRFEMSILVELINAPWRCVSRDELSAALYPEGVHKPMSNGLEVFVKRIREKIDPDGTHKPIETFRGKGYKFRTDWSDQQLRPIVAAMQASQR